MECASPGTGHAGLPGRILVFVLCTVGSSYVISLWFGKIALAAVCAYACTCVHVHVLAYTSS